MKISSSETAQYFRERGQESLEWAAEAPADSDVREGFARLAAAWFEAAAEAEVAATNFWTGQPEQPPTLH